MWSALSSVHISSEILSRTERAFSRACLMQERMESGLRRSSVRKRAASPCRGSG